MITLPNGKICMNEQEAIAWLLDNFPIPFQCSANYAAGTEIGLGTIVNPTPAKVKVGSIIFFADSKVSTVVGVTSNGFICSDQYNDLVDDVVYVSNVQLNASGHLIVTLSNGTNIDAGLIKQINSLTINSSQHFIVTYNDGTSADLGSLGDYSNVDFVAKTFKQTNANFTTGNLTFNLSAGMISQGLQIENIYNRVEEINNVLYVVANIKISNPTLSEVIISAGNTVFDASTALPTEIAEKIIDFEGKKVSEIALTNYCIITGHGVFASKGVGYADVIASDWELFVTNRTVANTMTIIFAKTSDLTIPANSAIYLSARLPLTLL